MSLAPASTRARGSAPQIPQFVSQFSPPGQRCEDVFGALDPVDKVAICGALNTADENIGKLASAIREYAESLLADRARLKRRLDTYIDAARMEKEATGVVAEKTEEKLVDAAVEYTATIKQVQKLEKQLDAYKKLPGVIGAYNEYFAKLVATLQGAGTAKPTTTQPQNVEEEGEDLDASILREFTAITSKMETPVAKISQLTKVVDKMEKGMGKYDEEDRESFMELLTELRKWIEMFRRVDLDFGNLESGFSQLSPKDRDHFENQITAYRTQWLKNVRNDLGEAVELFKPLMVEYINAIANSAQIKLDEAMRAQGEVEIPLSPTLRKQQREKEKRERAVQQKRQPTQPIDSLRAIMADDTTLESKQSAMQDVINKVGDERLHNLLQMWVQIYTAITQTPTPAVTEVTRENAQQLLDSLTAVKQRFAQRIGNLITATKQEDEYKALLQNYLNSKYDPKIQAAQRMSAN